MEKTDEKTGLQEWYAKQLHDSLMRPSVPHESIPLKGIYMVLLRIANALEQANRDREYR